MKGLIAFAAVSTDSAYSKEARMEVEREDIPIPLKGAAHGCSGRGKGGHSVLLVLRIATWTWREKREARSEKREAGGEG